MTTKTTTLTTAAEAAYTTAAADYAACNINPTTPGETFGIAWGADGEVLTYEQTIEAVIDSVTGSINDKYLVFKNDRITV